MFIGRIITKGKNTETIDFVDITQNLEITDKTIPTLIIGKANAEKIYGKDKVRVLDKKIEDNIYWTFGKLERRNDFERDLLKFNELLVKNLLSSIKYEYINLFTTTKTEIKGLLNKINNSKKNIFYLTDKHLYYLNEKIVYGIAFNELEYIGIVRDKIISYIKSKKNTKILYNDYFISKNMRKYLNNNKIIVPYLYFLGKN